MAAYYEDWASRQVWESTTVQAMSLAVRSTTFAEVDLGKLRRSHVEAWVKSMVTTGLAAGTIKTRVNNVRAVLRAAVRDRVIVSDPSEGMTLPRGRRADAGMTVPTVEQIRAILDGADDPFRAFVAVAAFAGLRLGEAAALQVGDVDFLRRTLTVSRQVQRAPGGAVEVRAPKYASERTVYVPDALLDILAGHLERHRPGDDRSRWVFEATPGQPPHQNTVGYQWRRACARASITGITLHDCRHFYASGLIAAGCDVVTVQRALGHAKATTTLNTYAHLWPSAEDRTRKAAGELAVAVLAGDADFARTAEEA